MILRRIGLAVVIIIGGLIFGYFFVLLMIPAVVGLLGGTPPFGDTLSEEDTPLSEDERLALRRSIHWMYVSPRISPGFTPGGADVLFQFEKTMFMVDSDGSVLREIIPSERFEDRDYSPSVSPDGSRVAFATYRYKSGLILNRDRNWEIATAALDGSDVRRLTNDTSFDFNPAWSPDGTRIAFVSNRDGDYEIYTMGADGSDARRVAPSINTAGFPVWSPDGRRIAFVNTEYFEYEGPHYLYVVGSDSAGLRKVSETRSQPAWSPDGSRIAFVNPEPEPEHICIVNLGGAAIEGVSPEEVCVGYGTRETITPDSRINSISWSPDGREILYAGNTGRGNAVYVANVGTGQSRRLLKSETSQLSAAWFPSGSRIVVSASAPHPNRETNAIVFTVSPDGSDGRILARLGDTGRLEAANGELLFPDPTSMSVPATTPTTRSGIASTSVAQAVAAPVVIPPCADVDTASEACSTRDVSSFRLFSASQPGAAQTHEETETVEDLLELGLRLAGAAPVHIAIRGTAAEGSVRCEWRGVARTPEQREASIRFWLSLDDDDPMPSAAEAESQFMRYVNQMDPRFRDTMRENFLSLAQGGLSTEVVFLACYADYSVSEYLLGRGPSKLSVAYDRMGEARSYELYKDAHAAGRFGPETSTPLMSEGEYQTFLDSTVWDAESTLAGILEGRESVVFLAPMGAHNAIAVEAWQAVAQWDVQRADDGTVNAVRYGASPGDPEHTQTLANLKSRVSAAAATSTTTRIAGVSGLNRYYLDIGAYDDITPGDNATTTFTPAQPPSAYAPAPASLTATGSGEDTANLS